MPLTILQLPVPTVGMLPASVTVVNPQVAEPVWSGPALAVVGTLLKVIITSSMELVHGLLLIVHRKVYVFPATPLNAEVELEGVAIVPPVPLTILQLPVPIVGVFADKLTYVSPHVVASVLSAPALEVVGFLLKVIITSSVEMQGLFVMVHRSV